MPTTKVRAPDGRVITVQHPEGASRDQIIQFAQQQSQAPAPAPAQPQGRVGTIADPLAEGALFGFGDEIAGALGAIPAALSTGQSVGESYRGIRDVARERAAGYAQENPGTALAANVAGGLLTGGAGGARALAGTTGRQMLGRSAALGAGTGGAAGLGMSEGETLGQMASDAATGAAVGGIAGAAFPAAGQQLARFRQGAMDAASSGPYQAAVRRLENADINLTSGQATGANWLKNLEGTLPDVPLGGKPLQRVFENQRQQVQRRLWTLAGLPADEIADDGLLTATNIRRAQDRFAQRYASIIGNRKVNLADDQQFIDDLAAVEAFASELGDETAMRTARNAVNNLLNDAIAQPRSGRWLQGRRSQYSSQEKLRGPSTQVYERLKRAMDDALARASGNTKGDIDAQYANFARLRDMYDRMAGGAEGAEGLIPLTQLARSTRRQKSTNEFQQLAEDAGMVMTGRLGNSGTAQRAMLLGMLSGGGMAMDPLSLIYGPAIARAASNTLASGRRFNLSPLLPGGQALQNPLLPGAAGVTGGLLVGGQ